MEQYYFRNYQINENSQEKGRGYYCWKLRKRNSKTKIFSETARVDQPQPSAQSEKEEPEQYRKFYEETNQELTWNIWKYQYHT